MCGCRIIVRRGIGGRVEFPEIIYCTTHDRAFQLAQSLRDVLSYTGTESRCPATILDRARELVKEVDQS